MVKDIVKDTFFLSIPSEEATMDDRQVINDLIDTLRANADICAGLAANMIGVNKKIIAVNTDYLIIVMNNPVIIKKSKPYDTEEECLSLEGSRSTTRYEHIEVEYLDINFQKRKEKFSGWVAEIIQHEIDHCNGILI